MCPKGFKWIVIFFDWIKKMKNPTRFVGKGFVEVGSGFEPLYTVLQTAA